MPRPLFNKPYSTVLEDRNSVLLGARIAEDGQWRFPTPDSLPKKYANCVVAFEDKRFWYHPGVDPLSLFRAIRQNIQQGKVVSGASTISMQVIRLAQNNPPRTIWEKLKELVMATRLEAGYSKEHILRLYAGHAPFGGNVVGIEAASWRYFNKAPSVLSWAEAATLAVLPNNPALIHPGRNRDALLAKRNRLLQILNKEGKIDAITTELAMEEPLPDAPTPLPRLAPHLLDRMEAANPEKNRFKTSIQADLQRQANEILSRHQLVNRGNQIHNLAAVIIDVPSGEVLAYVGNVLGAGSEHGEQVDVIRAPRSTGSILKPFLHTLALESGTILPQSLLTDVPVQLGRYKPENYYENYDGVVSAQRALVRSLNVPFVLLLQEYGLEKYHYNLKRLGFTTINKSPGHYGLSLILGGAEANLLDITNTYACMARRLGAFYQRNGMYAENDFRPASFQVRPVEQEKLLKQNDLLSAGAIWHTFEAMQHVERPASAGEWELFQTSSPIAWKTGTRFGFRDAWASGVNSSYAVGVWVGNADGEGRPGLVGVQRAAPVLFDLFAILPDADWFDPPYDAMALIPVCRESGYRKGNYCEADSVWVPKSGLKAPACTYHQLLHLSPDGAWQVHADCELPDRMPHVPWFILPPLEEYYFKSRNPSYQVPPPFREDCRNGMQTASNYQPMQLIYPKAHTKIYVPVDLDGKLSSTVFQVAHRNPDSEIYWHLDGTYLGSTKHFHEMALQPSIGNHQLTLVDAQGYRLEEHFEILGKN
ncbi:MAG: penicillin-binding protein 1C [Saprospiraceae bacterium]